MSFFAQPTIQPIVENDGQRQCSIVYDTVKLPLVKVTLTSDSQFRVYLRTEKGEYFGLPFSAENPERTSGNRWIRKALVERVDPETPVVNEIMETIEQAQAMLLDPDSQVTAE